MSEAQTLLVEGQEVALDKEGYLVNLEHWNEVVATALAAKEQIT